jgi:hypothetical protein
MRQIVLAVRLSAVVWPGAGQLYNREFQKGFILIGLTLLFGLSLFMTAGVGIAKHMPPDATTFDMAQARILSDTIVRENAKFFTTFNLLMMATWIYSIVDAYLGARDRLKPPTAGSKDDSSDGEAS